MIFNEEFLLEATFLNDNNLKRHYDSHVLKQGEEFNPDDPKFPYMSMEEYAKRAEELSLEDAGRSDDYTHNTRVIGFEIENGRKVKFRKTCPFYPDKKFSEMVMYVDDDYRGNEVINYMVGRPTKIYNMKRQYVDELPENKTTDDLIDDLYSIDN